MDRIVLYVGDKFSDIGFENITSEELKKYGFTEGVGCINFKSEDFDVNNCIDDCKRICKEVNSELAVVYKDEFEDNISISFYHKQ